MHYERHQAWSILLRLYHWGFALSITALAITGFYIHFPWTNTMIEGGAGSSFPVNTMRYIHFLAGFVFTSALLARIYLLFFGNRQERLLNCLPFTSWGRKNLFKTLSYYLYLTDKHEHPLGHNTLACTAYFFTFIMAAIQIISGFFMFYPEHQTWQALGIRFFGSQQEARFLHYLFMWYFLLFAGFHVYIVIWNDIRSKEGLISSIFTGSKYKPGKV